MSFASNRNPSRQATGVVTVVALHALIIYALANGLGHQVVEIIRAPLETRVIDDVKKTPEKVVPPPQPKLAPPPPPFIPLPDFKVQAPAASNAITAVTTVKPVVEAPKPPPPPVVAEVVRVSPAFDTSKNCAKPEYPSISRRLEETGSVLLALLVDEEGKVIDGKIEKSSGFGRLDNAALSALQMCQFTPGMANGKPEKAWARVPYTWKLE